MSSTTLKIILIETFALFVHRRQLLSVDKQQEVNIRLTQNQGLQNKNFGIRGD